MENGDICVGVKVDDICVRLENGDVRRRNETHGCVSGGRGLGRILPFRAERSVARERSERALYISTNGLLIARAVPWAVRD